MLNVFWGFLVCCVLGGRWDLSSQGANVQETGDLTQRCWRGAGDTLRRLLIYPSSLIHRILCVGFFRERISEPRPDWVHKPVELGPVGG